MATNKLMGSGPTPMTGGSADGPSPSLTGTLGVAPQASPQAQPTNMLAQRPSPPMGAQGPMSGMAQPPVTPPSQAQLFEASHKQSIVTAHLKALLGKPDLKTKDILNAVGEVIADGVMGPFDAAKYLSDLPNADADSLQLRQWVAQHYANATKALATVSEMIAAHGQMTRRMQAQHSQGGPSMPSPQAPPANAFGAAQ